MQLRRGRPTGYVMSDETKEKIRKSRLGRLHSEETRRKIAMGMNNGASAVLIRFIEFATMFIVKARRTAYCNPVMQDIIDAFAAKENVRKDTVSGYAVKYRVCLEQHGFISVANVNTIDRRIRFINPTPLFPSSRGATKQINDLNDLVIEYIRYIYRLKDRVRSEHIGHRPKRRFKYNGI